jgi:hypothetical protein
VIRFRDEAKLESNVIMSMLFCRYCRRAKGVFKDLNKEPFVVELDERGIVIFLLMIYFSHENGDQV